MASKSLVIDTEVLREAAGAAVAALKVLADVDWLMLLCQLSQGELCVSELEAALQIHQPTLSQQLGALRSECVAKTRRTSKSWRCCTALTTLRTDPADRLERIHSGPLGHRGAHRHRGRHDRCPGHVAYAGLFFEIS